MNSNNFVFDNDRFIGNFEGLYQSEDDPWGQSTNEKFATEKAICLNLVRRFRCSNIVEFGSGLGHFTKRLSEVAESVIGVEVARTAVEKARANYQEIEFRVGSFPDIEFLKERRPDCIVMAEISWYVLEQLDGFIDFLKAEMPDVLLIHLLTTYDPGVQRVGRDKFTNLKEISAYFGMTVLESGDIRRLDGSRRTYFAGRFNHVEGHS